MGEPLVIDGEQNKPNDSAVRWEPLTYEPVIARASVRLRLAKLFDKTAESWDKEQELKVKRSDEWLSKALGKYEQGLGFSDNGPGKDPISKLWVNTYGIPNVGKPSTEQADRMIDYVHSVFTPVIGKAALAVQEEMAEFVMGVGPRATALEQLNKFRRHYEGLVEALRLCKPQQAEACAMIAHYDDWVVNLVDLVNDGGNKRLLRSEDKLPELVDRALQSKEAQRTATKLTTGSPAVDLHNFYMLTNELQSLCSKSFLRKGSEQDVAGKAKSDLARMTESQGYFDKVDRLLEIVGDGRRVDEAFHALVVAATLNLEDKMAHFGGKMVLGLKRVLKNHYKGKSPDLQHPVLLMTATLFQGDPIPIELPQLETYFQDGHHADVLVAESNLKAKPIQRLIDAGLDAARRKWRRK
ncbi:hypothetical protein N185_17220 [Sinorhizobium sp. GW3]|nr:hypothetical protein N185_17220 [Sinorhizobium sp. GW3]